MCSGGWDEMRQEGSTWEGWGSMLDGMEEAGCGLGRTRQRHQLTNGSDAPSLAQLGVWNGHALLPQA